MDYEIFLDDEETGLMVSNLGRVVGKRGYVLHPSLDKKGYVPVMYTDSRGKRRFVKLHRLVARNFIPNPRNLPQINHRDECKSNNRVDNLEWCNNSYNQLYGTVQERRKTRMIMDGVSRYVRITDGNEVRYYNSIGEAARDIGLNRKSLSKVISGKLKSTGGWYVVDNPPYDKRRKLTLTDGYRVISFCSINSAAKHLGLSAGNLSAVVRGVRKQTKGWSIVKENRNGSKMA